MHLLHDPSKIQSSSETKILHALTIKMGSIPAQQPVFLHNNIIKNYASFGDFYSAIKLFDEMSSRNVVSYNTMISACCQNGFLEEAWKLFSDMRKCDFKPSQFTFGGLLSCDSLAIFEGMQLQALIQKNGLFCADPFPGTALLSMYGRHGCLDEAIGVFECMPEKNLVSWNCMLSLFGQMGLVENCLNMLCELIRNEIGVSEYSFVGILSCFDGENKLQIGEQIHGAVIKYGFDCVASVSNSLLNMYAKCDVKCSAEKFFEQVLVMDIVSWNTLIGAMVKSARPARAFDLFLEMCAHEFLPNETTFVNVLSSCTSMQTSLYGKLIHGKMIKKRFEADVYAGSALVDFYAKFDKVEEAHLCFDEITEKTLVSWNSLMLGYSNIDFSVTVGLLKDMIYLGYQPNEFSFSIVIKSSSPLELFQLHALTVKLGYQENAYVLSSLVSSYTRNGFETDALIFVASYITPLSVVTSNVIAGIYNRTGQYEKTQELFAVMEEPDIVSWNILIAACSKNGDYKEVFELFDHMRRSLVSPDNYTFVSLFSVCTKLCNLALGSSLHGLIIKTDFRSCDTFVCNIMIDMYGKCGSPESSVKIFNEIKKRNVISWTSLISALGLHGHANEALDKFREMEAEGFWPDKVAFLAVLSSCRHVGDVGRGTELFGQMKSKYGVEPEMDHYLLVVDLLARYGHLKEAERLILGMPFPPNALIWRSFLEGCKRQRTMDDLALAA